MQDRSCTATKQSQKSAYNTPAVGNMKKSTGQNQNSAADRTKTGSNGNWGPHFKNREHFNSMHFC
ncbi:uncharacterized protein LOC128273050 [Anopheles cruzii]|uniref:uncharacterized protein LOC128273050 n=1 Tax=Anopheles cruzii TaxID=68878 RepID=UPI0022EC5BE1|nr:uncharacterized protein LOC128273050 [Anopheles cruzii]